ncbi:MAG: nuclear transport factor 2 family protein [Capsulimonas sp.]|uniref:nuclear transport factor 2 family protein n=1 Tax=Capsulimonas sp. TaxID=2494211 RepID=UPI003267E6AC
MKIAAHFSALVCALGLLTIAPAHAAPKPSPAANKALVVKFYNEFFNAHHIDAALKYLTPDYKQHNPGVPTGRAAIISFFGPHFKQNPQSHATITQALADGDLVALHVHSQQNPKDRGLAIVDIFRVKNGKIVEHWDVVQPVPEKTANTNTMF